MFRIEYLKLKGHPELGDVEFSLSDKTDTSDQKPYTSMIIGPNGTGKSYILRTIAEIFRRLEHSKKTGVDFNLAYNILLKYRLDQNVFLIELKQGSASKTKILNLFKNLPESGLINRDLNISTLLKKHIIDLDRLKLPNKLIVNSLMLTDRFVWQNSKPSDFYQYLGVRSTSTTSSTRTSVKRTIKHLFNASKANPRFLSNLKSLLTFLDFEPSFQIQYSTKIKKLFFSGELTVENFKQYFEFWWDEKFEFSKRKKENPLWSVPYYNNEIKNSPLKIKEIIQYLNTISKETGKLEHKRKSSAKTINIDLFNKSLSDHDLKMIGYLENLDIINLDGIIVKKTNSSLSIDGLSSGEYHLLISLIGIFASIDQNSLVLIDEPEISLHPNWQMRYISFLKKVFSEFSSCQFIITTHSHFLVSDLEDKNSSITALWRESSQIQAILLEQDTYGWSAEEILYNVFKLKTVRNHFLEADLAELLGMISNNSKETKRIHELIKTIKSINISNNDPLTAVIEEAEAYLKLI